MVERTVLDLYRHDLEHPRRDHDVRAIPSGSRALSTEEFFATVIDELYGEVRR